MIEEGRVRLVLSLSCLLLLMVAVSLSTMCLFSCEALAQVQLYPEFTSVSCGDRVVRLSWSDQVEARLAQIADSLRGLGQTVPDSLKFGGYRIWRGQSADTSQMMLLRDFIQADTVAWTFVGDVREFVDPDSIFEIRLVKVKIGYDSAFVRTRVKLDIPGPFNGMGYYYSVTYYDSLGTQRSPKTAPGVDCFTHIPVHSVADRDASIERVWVVPNPYHGSCQWDGSEGRRIQFVNLPAKAAVRIYTVTGELVATLDHPDPDYFNYGSYGGALSWDLRNQNGREVVPGVYIFHVEGESGEEYRGHFVIIR